MTLDIRDLTTSASVDAVLVSAPEGLRPNRALADRLAVTHRATYERLVPDVAPDVAPSPEERLLRAIFGERADGSIGVCEEGATIHRGGALIDHRLYGVGFDLADSCTVERTARSTEDLPPGFIERITVVVTWPGPVTLGDTLIGRGTVDGIVEDGDSTPRLYTSDTSNTARIERSLPTASQRLTARGIGPYDLVTSAPLTGESLTEAQLEWLSESGGRAILSEMAAYTQGDRRLGPIAYEKLIKLEPLDDGYAATHGETKEL